MSTNVEKEIDISDLISRVWERKVPILTLTGILAIALMLVSLMLPNKYKSEAILASNQSSDAMASGLLAQFGGLAGIAGIDLGGPSTDPTVIALKTLESGEFLAQFIDKHSLKVALIASDGWDQSKGVWVIDPSIYDEKSGNWVRDVTFPKQKIPSDVEAVKEFRKLFSVTQDRKTSLITVSVITESPSISKAWVDALVSDANQYIRERAIAEANKSIEFLTKKVGETTVAEFQSAFSKLIEQQMKTSMLASVREDYAFKVVDPAFLPEEKYSPNRVFICLAGTFIGFFLSTFIVLLMGRRRNAISPSDGRADS
ncbi:LPS O-antigen length regulator [Permianibacter sp. IMCC34836]|uniref:Wzz/FepE/Etk N-terminal domain-containing protein n=1 Tax=Permianibacter fluminis TaxID=2738515 RepID=UPI001551F370|nr:Wzz/FepE/Etk N-terminal domain-containing protein [Permianibacter fluminis]NQD37403.1 LPS O-antigen length regulator [Permianibacter fluminis]